MKRNETQEQHNEEDALFQLLREKMYRCYKKTNEKDFVGFEVFTVVVMKSIIFWDITPCRLTLNRLYGVI
jgi:hypothetical protein